ncbi:unnamed protein product [Brassica rapa subsp. trilocularis]
MIKSGKPTLHVQNTCQPKTNAGTRVTLTVTATERDPTSRITSAETKTTTNFAGTHRDQK